MATLKDIARSLDLSITQVSRALNDHSDVSEETRLRVKATARAMNYHPNVSARKLVSGRSGIVGLVVPQHRNIGQDGIFIEVVAGLSAQFSGRGMQFVLHIMAEQESPLPVYQKLIGTALLDGFVLIDPLDRDPRIDFLRRAGVAFVVHGRSGETIDYPYFDIENEQLAHDLAAYLLARGHRRIAFLNGVAGRSYVTRREAGFVRALRTAGVPHIPELHLNGDMDEAQGLTGTIRLFTGAAPRPTAIVCGNVRLARGAYQALAALGLSVPGDVSVVAHDDELPALRASAFFPALTVTRAPLRDSWEPLADCLAGAIAGKPLASLQRIGSYSFIERNSVAPA
ncbi:substrate-binding domain-containing protein [Rhodobacter calidifons]|uniref:LacI family transcriptional regulator n=1 Tax=Rhodobacter calidifons TaxID=2715277 RepID=A0ABX0G7C1_9RHOB|nr:substrate-binding domain-containing protein [Rhodobacter calidifons]NHB77150.1 LacI family transcriptional regulator [Rhodobacter calidifons]